MVDPLSNSPPERFSRKKGAILLLHPIAAGSSLHRTVTRLAESIGAEVRLCERVSGLPQTLSEIQGGVSLAIFSFHLLDVVDACRLLHTRVPAAEMVLLCSPAHEETFRSQLGPLPRIGTHWRFSNPDNPDFLRSIQVAYRSGEQRRTVRTTLDRFNARLTSTPAAIDPHQLRKLVISDRFLANVLEHSTDAVLSLDGENRIVAFNPAAETLFGIAQSEAMSRTVTSIAGDACREDLLRLLNDGETKAPVSLTLPLPSGARTVEVSVNPIQDASGNRIASTLMLRDVTERQLAEDALRKAEALALTGRLAATVSHEINNPLEAIINLLYLLGTEELSGNAREYLKLANLELDRVSHIVKQTLGFYRDKNRKPNHAFDPKQAIDHIVRIYAGRLTNKSIRLSTDFAMEGELHMAMGDFQQIVSNLISNAIDACDRDGTIQIWMKSAEGRFLLSVEDSGGGVPKELMEKIFTPFFTTKQDVGTGLGLWVTKGIIEKYAGTISVRNSATGAIFTIEIPQGNAGLFRDVHMDDTHGRT